MIYDATDKALAVTIETAIKSANVNGIPAFTSSAMTEAQYSPAITGLSPTIGRDMNRDLAIAIVAALRQQPVRVPVCTTHSLPSAIEGGVIYVQDGAGGAAVLAFSDGVSWYRCDTRTAVG